MYTYSVRSTFVYLFACLFYGGLKHMLEAYIASIISTSVGWISSGQETPNIVVDTSRSQRGDDPNKSFAPLRKSWNVVNYVCRYICMYMSTSPDTTASHNLEQLASSSHLLH